MLPKKNISRRRIEQITDSDFDRVWDLYLASFPPKERRTQEAQRRVLLNELYHCEIIIADEKFIGFIFWWQFEQLRYVEHLALAPNQQNLGYGSQVLEQFLQESELPIILEVEKPETLVQQKRIKFYERLGFHLNAHDYIQAPYSKDQPPLPLLLMSWPHILSSKEYDFFIQECHPIIFST